jgi:hypothetical protein
MPRCADGTIQGGDEREAVVIEFCMALEKVAFGKRWSATVVPGKTGKRKTQKTQGSPN